MCFLSSNFTLKTSITYDEDTSMARIESYNVHLLETLRRSSGRQGVVCISDFPDFGVYVVPKEMVSVLAEKTFENMMSEASDYFLNENKTRFKKRMRKFGGNKCLR